MSKEELREDFINFEKSYYFFDLSENNFYALLHNPDVCDFIVNCIEKNHLIDPSLDKIFMKNILDLSQFFVTENINFKEFKYFKSNVDILYGYMLLFLIKTFSFKLKNSKIQKNEIELLAIRDFFLDRNDFVNIFLDYMFKFFLFNEIIHKRVFNYNKNSLRIFLFRFVEFCIKNNLIISKDLKVANRHYKILFFSLFYIPFIPEIVFYVKKFEVYVRFGADPYIYNTHFSSIVSIMKQATYSDATFKIQLEQVDVLTQRSFYIDRSLLLKNYNLLLKSSSLTESSDLSNLFNRYSSKIQNFLNEKDLQSLKTYHSKLSKILTLIRIKTILDMYFSDKELFLPFMFCFRGRVYELGDLSFTFYKEFRYCVYSGVYGDESEMFHPINSQINSTIDDHFHLFKKYY
jgi:hypothetical protein